MGGFLRAEGLLGPGIGAETEDGANGVEEVVAQAWLSPEKLTRGETKREVSVGGVCCTGNSGWLRSKRAESGEER